MFPEEFNALRKELYDNWREDIWPIAGYAMIFEKEIFIHYMNETCEVLVPIECEIVKMSKTYLDALRNKRGISSLFPESEKYEKDTRPKTNYIQLLS